VPLDIVVEQRLPLAWLRADDGHPGLVVRERELAASETLGQTLTNAWTLAPFERVVRHFHVEATRRGVHEIGPVRLSVGDLFAGLADEAERRSIDRLVVRPRTVAVHGLPARSRWGGGEPSRRGLLEHPLAYAGVRDYQPGDPLRRLHHRASARLGRPVTKRFDPAREREVLLALDLQTLDGPAWQPTYDDDLVESLCVAVGSLARHLRDGGAAVGLAVAGYAGAPRPIAVLAPSEASEQLPRILDLLAHLSPFPSATFDRLLGSLPQRMRPGTEIVVVTARDPGPYLGALRRLRSMGFGVTLLAIGPRAGHLVGRARAAASPLGPPARRHVGGLPWVGGGIDVSRAMALLPFALAVVAEGAWVAAVYAFVQAAAHAPAPLGPGPMAIAAGVGLAVARRFGPGLGARWPWVALGLVGLAGVVGVALSPAALVALRAGDPLEA
jgi:uncharacterized protein (DUF58 family)